VGQRSVQLSILIVNWNTAGDLLDCLQSLYAHPPACEFEVLVCDNASSDGSAARAASAFPRVRILAQAENLGFARANNRAAAAARGRLWLLLNPDTVVHAGAIDSLLHELASRPLTAAVGPRLVNPDGSLQPSIERLPTLLSEWWRLLHLDRLYPVSRYPAAMLASRAPQRVEVLNGACLLLRSEALGGMALFDPDYFVYSEEVDLCDRLRAAGWHLHWVPRALVTHRGGQSTRQVRDQMFVELYRNKVKFFRKRRGPVSVALYKLVLLQAALLRFAAGLAVRLLRLWRLAAWEDIGRQYQMLLRALPSL
jgi:N-acetylglucosaminyl-diphospho-decaprenol L-rhamnosyltransferase